MHLNEDMKSAAITAATKPSSNVSYQKMIFGLLTKQILEDATILGFSRSASSINKVFLTDESEVYSIEKLSREDVMDFIEKSTEEKKQREEIRQQIRKIAWELQNDILLSYNYSIVRLLNNLKLAIANDLE